VHLFGDNLHHLALMAVGVKQDDEVADPKLPRCSLKASEGPTACANYY
jgi:hypothetical protein